MLIETNGRKTIVPVHVYHDVLEIFALDDPEMLRVLYHLINKISEVFSYTEEVPWQQRTVRLYYSNLTGGEKRAFLQILGAALVKNQDGSVGYRRSGEWAYTVLHR